MRRQHHHGLQRRPPSAQPPWPAADLLEQQMPALLGLLMREAGKTCANAIAEVREAVDFLRYYGAQVQHGFDNTTHIPLGPVACISPWNFPLAIFMGQVAAALAAGNTVLAKTGRTDAADCRTGGTRLVAGGIPAPPCNCCPARARPWVHAWWQTNASWAWCSPARPRWRALLQRSIAGRLDAAGHPVVLIAETGGQTP